MKLFTVVATVLVVLVAAGTASAGCMATVGLSSTPKADLAPGQAWFVYQSSRNSDNRGPEKCIIGRCDGRGLALSGCCVSPFLILQAVSGVTRILIGNEPRRMAASQDAARTRGDTLQPTLSAGLRHSDEL